MSASPPELPTPTPRSERWGMAELQKKVDWLLKNTPAEEVYTLKLEDIEFNEQINVHQLLGADDEQAEILCPFAWDVRHCTFLEGFIAAGITFQENFTCYPTEFFGKLTDFSHATFSGERTDFSRATFSGENTDFSRATFSGERTDFSGATFSGNSTYFSGANFSGERTDFSGATFSGNSTDFSGATFSGNSTDFSGATFSRENTDFSRATFSGNSTDFRGATFSGNSTNFSGAMFSGEYTNFRLATFSRKRTDFSGATFSGERTDFSWAKFSGECTNFSHATFSAENTDFSRATFSGNSTDFSNATFSGGAIQFDNTVVDSTVLTFDWPYFENEAQLVFTNCQFKNAATEEGFLNEAGIAFASLRTHEKKERIRISNDVLKKTAKPTLKRYRFVGCSLRPGSVTISQFDATELEIIEGNGLVGFTFDHCLWPKRKVGGLLGLGLTLYCSPTDREENVAKAKNQHENDKLTYARLKEEAKSQGDAQLASHFHFWQLWNRYHAMPWEEGKLEKLVLWFYLITSAFGLSLVRPLLSLGIVWLSFGISYALLLGTIKGTFNPSLLTAYFGCWLSLYSFNRFYQLIKGRPALILLFIALLFVTAFYWAPALSLGVGFNDLLDPDSFKEGLQLALSHSNPLENLDLIEVLPKVGIAKEAIEPKLKGDWGLLLHALFWLGFMTQNALGLYLLFQFGAAARNKVRQ